MSFDELVNVIRHLKGLPLPIASIQVRRQCIIISTLLLCQVLLSLLFWLQGISPTFRYTEVFPPPQQGDTSYPPTHAHALEAILVFETRSIALLSSDLYFLETFSDTVNSVYCSFAWPPNVRAIQHLKTAFYIRLARLLERHHNIKSTAMPTALDVHHNGYVFRINIFVVRWR